MRRALFLALIASGVLSSCTLSRSTSACANPVEISKDAFDFKSYFQIADEEIKAGQLQQALDEKWLDTYQVVSVETSAQKQVSSCADYAQTPLPGWEPSTPSDFAPYQLMSEKCKLLTLLAKATPSKTTFVQNLEIDEHFIKSLPKSLAFITSESEMNRIMKQTSTSKLGEVSEVLSVIPKAHKSAEARVPGGTQTFTVAAMGDFNQDSIEDMLLLVTNASSEGTYATSNTVVVTRMKEKEDLQIIVP